VNVFSGSGTVLIFANDTSRRSARNGTLFEAFLKFLLYIELRFKNKRVKFSKITPSDLKSTDALQMKLMQSHINQILDYTRFGITFKVSENEFAVGLKIIQTLHDYWN